MSSSSSKVSLMLLLYVFMNVVLIPALAGNFYRDFAITWGDHRAGIRNGGQILTLSLDKASGSGVRSRNEYLFGRFDMQMKLVPGNSAGTVTTFYFTSQGPTHDEIDFEFLGNLSGQPYILQTNVYSQGKGSREQQFYLWFDPTANFHTYSIIWNFRKIMYKLRFLVDKIPIRVFNNLEFIGVPFPKSQPMRIYTSIWNANDWATRGGLIKTDWTKAPFTALYRNFNADACVRSSRFCRYKFSNYTLDPKARHKLRWAQNKYMIYNYCRDFKRFSKGLPRECKQTRFL